MDSQQQSDKAKRSLQIMQAALEKAKTTHGDLYTFGDCATLYTAMMTLNSFIELSSTQVTQSQQTQPSVQMPQQTPPSVQMPQQTQPFLTLNQLNKN
jgi:hypothetical protein